MDPKEGDYVRLKHMRVETTGTVIKRSGTHIRMQPKDGGATLWKELSELLPLASAVNEASEVAELQRLFSSEPSSARANALSARGALAQAAAKQKGPKSLGCQRPCQSLLWGPCKRLHPRSSALRRKMPTMTTGTTPTSTASTTPLQWRHKRLR
jgi:hypothetical protein